MLKFDFLSFFFRYVFVFGLFLIIRMCIVGFVVFVGICGDVIGKW